LQNIGNRSLDYRLEYRKLTFSGSTKIKSADPQKGGDRITLDLWMENQNGVKTMVGEAGCLG
jgi:hypothetical protein